MAEWLRATIVSAEEGPRHYKGWPVDNEVLLEIEGLLVWTKDRRGLTNDFNIGDEVQVLLEPSIVGNEEESKCTLNGDEMNELTKRLGMELPDGDRFLLTILKVK